MLEDAQKQAGQVSRTIADKTLLIFASTSMLMIERYPRTNDDWEDKTEEHKTRADWKTAYKRAYAKCAQRHKPLKGQTSLVRQMRPRGSSKQAKWRRTTAATSWA